MAGHIGISTLLVLPQTDLTDTLCAAFDRTTASRAHLGLPSIGATLKAALNTLVRPWGHQKWVLVPICPEIRLSGNNGGYLCHLSWLIYKPAHTAKFLLQPTSTHFKIKWVNIVDWIWILGILYQNYKNWKIHVPGLRIWMIYNLVF